MEINNLSYTYKNTDKEVLKDITCKIKQGEITCIIGKNGSGKTTLLELLANLRIPTEGEIKYQKYSINKDSSLLGHDFWFEVSYCSISNDNLLNTSIRDNFMLRLKQFNYNASKIKERVINSLKMLELDESYLEKNVKDLSHGEKLKIQIAYSLLQNPKVLLIDNPTVSLDEKGTKNLIRIIKLLKRRYNKTIVIATNDMEFVNKIADRVILLDKTKIVLDDGKYEVFKQEDKIKKLNILPPKTIAFSNKVLKEKNIKIGYRDEINDLIKDIYRYVK